MPKYIAFSWETPSSSAGSAERNEMTVLTADVNGKKITVEQTVVVKDAKELAEFVRQHKLAKSHAVAVLSRNSVEVRPMLFPPVPLDELPLLVQFQGAKEFNHYAPNDLLDFFVTKRCDNVSRSTFFPALPTSSSKSVSPNTAAGSPRYVLASSLRREEYDKIQRFCNDVDIHLRSAVLQPYETVYLWQRAAETDASLPVLLVELDAEHTALTAVLQGEPVFTRSPRIWCPDDVSNPDFAARLAAELKRSRAAVRNEIQSIAVENVVLCGTGLQYESLASQLSDAMDMPVTLFDPWKQVSSDTPPKRPERFAALLGAVNRLATRETYPVDFCCPKKAKEPASRRNIMTAVAATAIILFLVLMGYGFYYRIVLQDNVKKLSQEFNALQTAAGNVVEERVQLNGLDSWLADKVDWFGQLGWLSEKAPKSQDMVVTEMSLASQNGNGGVMTLKTQLRDGSILSPMEEGLQDNHHLVKTGERSEITGSSKYNFRCNVSIQLTENVK